MKKFIKLKNRIKSTINFDRSGVPITKHSPHPVVIFYIDNYVYYLNSQTNKPNKLKPTGLIELVDKDGYKSFVDLTSIQFMEITKFESLYKPGSFYDLNKDVDAKQAKYIYDALYKRLKNDGSLTIQEVELKYQNTFSESRVLYSNIPRTIAKHKLDINSSEAQAALAKVYNVLKTIYALNDKEFQMFRQDLYNGKKILDASSEIDLAKELDSIDLLDEADAQDEITINEALESQSADKKSFDDISDSEEETDTDSYTNTNDEGPKLSH